MNKAAHRVTSFAMVCFFVISSNGEEPFAEASPVPQSEKTSATGEKGSLQQIFKGFLRGNKKPSSERKKRDHAIFVRQPEKEKFSTTLVLAEKQENEFLPVLPPLDWDKELSQMTKASSSKTSSSATTIVEKNDTTRISPVDLDDLESLSKKPAPAGQKNSKKDEAEFLELPPAL